MLAGSLTLERLEDRLLYAGDVTVTLKNGNVSVRGDQSGNDLVLRMAEGVFLIEGRNQTTINGSNQPFRLTTSSIAGDLKVDLRGGDDVVQIDDVVVLGRVTIRTGSGHDVLAAPGLSVRQDLRVSTGRGSDTLLWGSLSVDGHLRIRAGSGNDQVGLIDDIRLAGGMNIQTASGADTVVVAPSYGQGTGTGAGTHVIKLRGGNDLCAVDSAASFAAGLNVLGGGGFDQYHDANSGGTRPGQVHAIESRNTLNINGLIDAAFASLDRVGISRTIFDGPAGQAPTISVANSTITYIENGAGLPIDASLTVADSDSNLLTGATVTLASGFVTGQDLLEFTPQSGITGTYNAATGVLTFTGSASAASYQQLLRSVTYRNTSDDPSTSDRLVRFTVTDGQLSGTDDRTLAVEAEDDPGTLTLPPEFSGTSIPQRGVGTTIAFTATVTDLDDHDYVFQLDLEASGLPASAAQPTINAQTGRFEWTPSVTGTFEIRILAVNGNGYVNQETFRIQIT